MIVRQPGGATVDLGRTEEGATISLQDYSRLETDDFGVTTVVKRGFSRKMSVRLAVATDQVDSVQRRLADLRAKTTLWTADPRFAWLTVDGFYTDFSVDFAVPPLSYCSLTIEGLAETETVPDAGGDPAPEGKASDLRVLQPIDVTDGILLSSNVPETDAPQWASGTTYSLGAKVVAAHRVFESLVASNVGNTPATSPGAWLDIGPTNRWAMFDQALGTTTSRSSSIVVTLPAGQIKALALLDVVGTSVRVQAPRATAPHYDRTVSVTGAAITFLDLPGVNGTATVTITGSSTVSVGTLLAGRLLALGRTEAAPTAGIIDYSTKEVDDFGEVTLVERAWAKEMSLRSLIRSDAVDVVGNRIAALRGQPCLWIGREGQDALSVYGFFKDFSIEVLQNVSKVSLSIQGLSAAAAVEGVAALPVPWPSITDPAGTKPADNATVGAPPGTNVGGIPAEEVVSRLDTLNTETIPAINDAVADTNGRIVAARQAADAGIASANTRLDGVRDDLAAEVARAVGADEAITTRIDAIVAEGGYDDTQVRALIQSEATARADGDRALGQRVDTVTTDYKAADTSTNTRISSVETAYADADRALGQRIDTVVTDYKAGDTATNTRITNEATASSDRDAALGRRIDSIVAEGGYDDTDVRAEISRVETAAVSRDQALGQRIDTTQAGFGDAINAKAQEITTAYAAADKSLADRIRVTEASSVVGGEALNANASFAVWPESDPYPSRWNGWGDVGPVNRLANSLGGGGFMVEHSPAGINSGLLVPNVFLTRGWYVMEADVWLTSGSWNGAGMTLHGEYSLDFMADKDVAEDIGDTSSGGVRRFRKLFQIPAGGEGYKNVHLMGNWDSFGRGYTAKTVRWLRCGVRPATDAEIASRKVEAANVIARVTAAETALTDGRFATAQRAANIEAAVGAVGGRVSAVETVTSNGTFATAVRAEQIASYAGGVEAKVDLQAGTIAGLGQKTAAYVRLVADAGGGRAALSLWSDQYGGAWSLTGDGLIDGDLTVTGSIRAEKFNRDSMSREGSSSWTGTIQPAAGQTITVPWSLSLTNIPPLGRFIYEYTFQLVTNAGQTITTSFNGRPYRTSYRGDGGLRISATDNQGNAYTPRANSSSAVLASTPFVPNFTASVSMGNYDSGIIDDGDSYRRILSATYTLYLIDLKVTWVAV